MKNKKLLLRMSRAELVEAVKELKVIKELVKTDTRPTVIQKMEKLTVHLTLLTDIMLILIFQMIFPRNTVKKNRKPQLQKLCLFADNLPVSWGKIVKTSAADYEDRINELWGAGKYRSAKWNQKLAWFCALSNLGLYLWLKAWKPVSTVFRRLL